MTRLPGTLVFLVATLALLGGAAWVTWTTLRIRSLLRESIAVVLLGLSGALGYETLAYGSGRAPTISALLAGLFALHPVGYALVFLPLVGLIGALSFHFVAKGRRARWWVFAAGAVAYVIGGLIAFSAGWIPN